MLSHWKREIQRLGVEKFDGGFGRSLWKIDVHALFSFHKAEHSYRKWVFGQPPEGGTCA